MEQRNHIIIYSISYLLFFAMLLMSKKRHGNRLFDERGKVSNQKILLLLHITGILLFGVLPATFSALRLDEIVFGKSSPGDLPVLVSVFFVLLAMFVAPMVAEKKFILMKVNESAITSFSPGFIANYFLLRVVFLMAYELWFRGYLLIDCISRWGIMVAIVVNIAFYVLLHCVNGKDEMRACVPLGLLLCILCAWTGAAWPAIAIHIALAVGYEAHIVKRINKPSISLI